MNLPTSGNAKPISGQDLEKIRTLCRSNLKFLCKELLGMKDWSGVHDEIATFLKTSGNRKLILIPRNHLKSSIVTKGWTIQKVLNNPDLRILIANAVWDNSRKFLRSIQKYLTWGSPLPMYFGKFESESWNQDECTVKQRKVVLDAPTWATTGLEKEQTSQHYDVILCDDLVAKENCTTPEQRKKVFEYYLSLFDLLEPEGVMVLMGTRYHQDDLYAKVLEETDVLKNWDTFIRSAYKEDGSVLFPQKFTKEKLDEIKNKPGAAYHFASQYMNNPIDPDSSDFKLEQIRFYDYDPVNNPHPSSLYLTVDPAISLGRDADYSALLVAGQYANRRIRVVDRVRGRFVPDDLVDQIFELVKKWRLHRVGIETFGFQKTLKYEIQRRQRETGVFFSIDELGRRHTGRSEPIVSKEARIRRLQPYFEQGLVEIRRDMSDLRDELLAFPRGKNDDLLDTLAYQLDYLVPSIGDQPAKKSNYWTYGWLLETKMPEVSGSLYDAFLKDLKDPAS